MAEIEDKTQQRRSRGWFIQRSFTFDTHDSDGQVTNDLTEDAWRKLVIKQWGDSVGKYDWLLMIFHDSDVLENTDGTTSPKPLHVHGLIRFRNARTQASVIKQMHLTRAQNCQPVKSYTDSARYLLHVSESALNAKKHIYSISEVLEFNQSIQDVMSRSAKSGKKRLNDKELIDYIDDLSVSIAKGRLTYHQAQVKLERDFGESKGHALWIRYNDRFDRDLKFALSEKARNAKINNRDLKTFYISGPGGAGKSQLAKGMALLLSNDDGNYHTAAASDKNKTFDMASSYKGENVSVLNDLSGSSFSLRAFFDNFDPHQYQPVSSRNYDKDWLPDYAFITCSDSFEAWSQDLLQFSQGGSKYMTDHSFDLNKDVTCKDMCQVVRRIPFRIDVRPLEKSEHGAVARLYIAAKDRCYYFFADKVCEDVTNIENVKRWANNCLNVFKVSEEDIEKHAEVCRKAYLEKYLKLWRMSEKDYDPSIYGHFAQTYGFRVGSVFGDTFG
jgi:energy-coupling factor transporter ATP-binding protein EcfA2